MKTATTLLCALLFFVLACKSPKTIIEEIPNGISSVFVDSLATSMMQTFPSNTQISIGIVNKDRHEHFGYSKIDSFINPIDNKHVLFQLGSITKVFTGILLGDAVLSNKVKLTDSLSTLLPYNFKNCGSITLEHLTTHTSGLYSYPLTFMAHKNYLENDPYQHIDEELVKGFLENNFEPQVAPGEKFEYSNLGIGLLAYIMAQKNKKSLFETYQEKILTPLGMNDTCLDIDQCDSEIAVGLTNEGKETPCWGFQDISAGAGGLLSNTKDMCKFITAVASNQFPAIEKSKTPLFRVRENTEICMNWFYPDLEDYGHCYTHGGGTGGFSTSIFIDDEMDFGIIVLSNVSAYHPQTSNIESISIEILNKLNAN